MLEKIIFNEEVFAMILYDSFNKEGLHFFTPDDYSQQLAFMKYSPGKIIEPHIHNVVNRTVFYTNEVLFIKKGKLRVDFYDDEQNFLESRELNKGDLILLIKGGHGFEVLEALEMIEVKQGPYAGDSDKIRFKYDETKINKGD
jgi:mannose-6-phosphate isomerase-like protein (cupin superfamily)